MKELTMYTLYTNNGTLFEGVHSVHLEKMLYIAQALADTYVTVFHIVNTEDCTVATCWKNNTEIQPNPKAHKNERA
jgi:hypothetical protein